MEPGPEWGSSTVPGQMFAPSHKLTPEDMLALQNDVTSELDRIIAQRLAYSIDHATGAIKNDAQMRQAADLLRDWNGSVDANAAAPAIVDAARAALWPMLLIPKLAPQAAGLLVQGADLSKVKNLPAEVERNANLWLLYRWGERDSVEEELVTHTPARWLPVGYPTWEDFSGGGCAARPASGPRSSRSEPLAAGKRLPATDRSPDLLPHRSGCAVAGNQPGWRNRPAIAERRQQHGEAGWPCLWPLRTLYRRPERSQPHDAEPCAWPVRRPCQPVVHGPVAELAARHYLSAAVHARRQPAHHHAYDDANAAMSIPDGQLHL